MRLSHSIARQSDIVRIRVLGSDASYRVLHEAGPIVQLEAIDVPGLAAGAHLYLTSSAVEHMRHAPALAAPRRATRRLHLASSCRLVTH